MSILHPLMRGTRVHHRGAIFSRDWDPAPGEGGWGWGTVLRAKLQSDGTFEYEVERDESPLPGGDLAYWWGSYHIDRVLAPA